LFDLCKLHNAIYDILSGIDKFYVTIKITKVDLVQSTTKLIEFSL